MDELFFGVKRKKSTTKRRASPKRHRRRSPMRRRRSPMRRRRASPRRCTKALSLPKLRKLALENGINIYSEARTAVSKRTGMPKKPKMVGCSTLKKRFDEAGLGHLYRVREMMQMEGPEGPEGPDGPTDLFEEGPSGPSAPSRVPQSVLIQADPACDSAFQELARQQPNNRAQAKFLKQYKGYALGQGPCDKRDLVPTHIHGDEDDLDDYADEAGFDMSFGRRYMAGARPRMHYKHVGEIVVRGRVHQVFKGKDGGLFYLKGKTGRKIYVDKKRLKKKSPKRSKRTRFGMDEDDEEEMEFGARKAVAYIMVNNRKRTLYRGMKGGLYYVKNNRKVYVKPSAVRHRRSPLRKRH